MRNVVMPFNVIEVDRVGDAGLLIKIRQVTLQVRIIDDATDVAFEVAVINDVEPDKCAEQPPISFNDALPEQVPTIRQAFFNFIERIEKLLAGDFVWPLARGEAGFVNAVVDIVVKKIAELGVLGFDLFREKIDIFVFRELVERAVKHGTNVVLTIVHDLFRFLVPKHRDGNSAVEPGIRCRVSFAQIMEAIDRIGRFERRVRRPFLRRITKGPAFLIANWIDNREPNCVLKSL